MPWVKVNARPLETSVLTRTDSPALKHAKAQRRNPQARGKGARGWGCRHGGCRELNLLVVLVDTYTNDQRPNPTHTWMRQTLPIARLGLVRAQFYNKQASFPICLFRCFASLVDSEQAYC
jgi:hypothetical protein